MEYHPALSSLTETMTDLLAHVEARASASNVPGTLTENVPPSSSLSSSKISQQESRRERECDSKETQTLATLDNKDCIKCLHHQKLVTPETSESQSTESQSIQLPQQPLLRKPTSNTDSSSPLSSNEFATADFYFEDSMPSPMTESEKKDKESASIVSAGKTKDGSGGIEAEISLKDDHYDDVKVLKDQLREKDATLGELRTLVDECQMEIAKLKWQLNVGGSVGSGGGGSSRSDDSESVTLVASNTLVAASSCDLLDKQDLSPDIFQTKAQTSDNSLIRPESSSLESSIRVQNRVKDLEEKLEKLSQDLDSSKESLLKAEQNLHSVHEQEQASLQEKDIMIAKLQTDVIAKEASLYDLKENLNGKQIKISDLEKTVEESHKKLKVLEGESVTANETLKKVKEKLRDFAIKAKENIPSLRRDMKEMKSAIRENLSQIESAKSEALALILSEREKLALEREEIELSVMKIQQELTQEIQNLKSENGELSSEMAKKEEHFAKKYAEQRYDYDSAIRDMDTKHALEMEIELDKCKSETRQSMEESERNYELLTSLKDNLMKEIEETRLQCSKRVGEMDLGHEVVIAEMDKSHKLKMKEQQKRHDQLVEEHAKQLKGLQVRCVANWNAFVVLKR